MKKTSCVSRNYFKRPKIRALVPEARLLLAVLTVGCESHVGVYIPSGEIEDTGLSGDSIHAAKSTLIFNSLIKVDDVTGEIFISDFFRDNTYKGPQRIGQAYTDFKAIESLTLKINVLEAIKDNKECGLTAVDLVEISTIVINQPANSEAEAEAEAKAEVEDIAAANLINENLKLLNNQAPKNSLLTKMEQQNQTLCIDSKTVAVNFADLVALGMVAPENQTDFDTMELIKSKFTSQQISEVVADVGGRLHRRPYCSNILTELNARYGAKSGSRKSATKPKLNRHRPPAKYDTDTVRRSNAEHQLRAAMSGGNVEVI